MLADEALNATAEEISAAAMREEEVEASASSGVLASSCRWCWRSWATCWRFRAAVPLRIACKRRL